MKPTGWRRGLPPLMIEADHLAASVSLGVHGRRRAGMGESFWQFRRYGQHDASSAIDWRASAKSQHLFVREREWEAAQTVWFWRDASANMRFGEKIEKRARADLLLLALASLLVRGGERVGFPGMEGAPAASRMALTRIGRALFSPSNQKTGEDAALPPAMPIARGSHFVWFSDFLGEGVEEAMRRLAHQGVTGHLVRIVDPAEEDFPFTGRAAFEAAGGGDTEVFGRAERVRDGYRARFTAHGEAITAAATRLGWTATAHRTDHAPQTVLIGLHAALGRPSDRMAMLSQLTFGAPWVLAALAVLPVLYWLLKVTPPLPKRIVFPPLRLLRQLKDKEQTPAKAPWWLLLLRLVAAALLIFALADPLLERIPN